MFKDIIIVKIGSSSLVDQTGRLSLPTVGSLLEQIKQLRQHNYDVVLVSSGAVACGVEALGLPARPQANDLAILQSCAAVGQVKLAEAYNKAGEISDIKLGQVLLTALDFENANSRQNAQNTLRKLLDLGVLPLINENDVTSIDELSFGDNDTLAARVAALLSAKQLVILSDIDGLYTANPLEDAAAKRISKIPEITDEIVSFAGNAHNTGSEHGSGGMASKVEAARIATVAGCETILTAWSDSALTDAVLAGKYGTVFSV